ncbi:hypothetical protein J3Q64DRAFT_1850188 [Phycomyces blakesleeanus]|uniref:Uncharacterized protein n=2 Tax=Phycomyces blakesleeanus TaxID=4837 RepID=A0A167PPV3_PHYB8|nr:hypothetical protein PHYBLDRAFT_140424 [Phycomyces blakesleeanus NRRL 1555(-)]OAD78326.1 hypothetical protein PHYBLDRAFT_140424 [Phycomyces blakesleeanus NRRL 1555(-)]|eukprot:XP_018296366.1 hypothetical protein PHYBLDRAFT_140424 [Phycomyces blakesleeanus NRRL 1555(-)]
MAQPPKIPSSPNQISSTAPIDPIDEFLVNFTENYKRNLPPSKAPKTSDSLTQSQDQNPDGLFTSIKRSPDIIPDSPLCFCKLPASKTDTPAFGIIFECHHFDFEQRLPKHKNGRYVCAFHVHERPWNKFRKQLKNTGSIDSYDFELDVCPVFNYTSCVILETFNRYLKRPCFPIKCFCELDAVVKRVDKDGKKKLALTCPNFFIDGARPKCSWYLYAEQVAYESPGYSIHTIRVKEPTTECPHQ